MFTAIYSLMMGTVGRFFGELYAKYHLYINFVVLLYGLSILWAHNNLRMIVRKMETGIVMIGSSEKFQRNYSGIQGAFSKRWNEANKGIFYFIPSQRDLWFEKIEGPQLIEVLHINDDFVKMTLHKKTGEPKANEFPQHIYLAWEDYRHNLVTGMRKKMPDPKKMEKKLKKI